MRKSDHLECPSPLIVLLIFTSFMLGVTMQAQQRDSLLVDNNPYHPLLKDDKHWYGKEVASALSKEFVCDYYLSGDTVISGETFFKCYRATNRYTQEGYDSAYYAALQESDRRIHAVERNSTEKKMIIDFNLQVGDSLHLALDGELYSIVPKGGNVHYALEKIDTVTACDGSQLKRYWFKGNPEGPWYDQWIEGVGTNSYPFIWNFFISSYVYELAGCYEDGTLFYGTTVPDDIIQSKQSRYDNNISHLYDLQGRKLQHTPQRGIYIKNGKKLGVR